jgi:hypothetical protein
MIAGKGWRVGGFFVFMLGAGLVLESPAVWYGLVMMSAGAIGFAWGLARARGSAA